MASIAGFTGTQIASGTEDYPELRYQYATSSYEDEPRMRPGLILLPKNKEDIARAILYARAQNVAVAIRTGGHQYCGASSTAAPNIQIDLRTTFQGPDDRVFFEGQDGKAYVRTSVSWSLGEFNAYLGKNQVFVPHGQCINVHVGGHVQTGGYGQLGRSFGLFGDHVRSLDLVDHEGKFKEVTRATDPELFYALLGGSPGNLGVITHFTIEVHRDRDYLGSRGLKSIYWYEPSTLTRLLTILAEMADNRDFPHNYDYCVSVLSSASKLLDLVPEADSLMREHHPELYGEDDNPFWPRMIIVYAQWVPFSSTDVPDTAWFDRIRHGSLFRLPVKVKPMSQLTSEWIFRNVREFDYPYIKRTRLTRSTTLVRDGWPAWLASRIDALIKPEKNRCWLSAQIQVFGGLHSAFTTNAGNGTSYSWRDSSVACTLDSFYDPKKHGAKADAEAWHAINDEEGVGPGGKFSDGEDRRVLWGSFGDVDLDAVWRCYYEDQNKYERLRRVRQAVDPDGVFTPNTFCVKR